MLFTFNKQSSTNKMINIINKNIIVKTYSNQA